MLPRSDLKFEFSKSSGCRQELFEARFATFRKEKSFLKGFLRKLKILQFFFRLPVEVVGTEGGQLRRGLGGLAGEDRQAPAPAELRRQPRQVLEL